MSKELVISSNHHETRVAILEDDQLVEIYFQRAHEYSLAGSIHKGRVTRVLPGMQSAFVDLGLERDTFLYVSDFFEEHADEFERVEERPAAKREGGGSRQEHSRAQQQSVQAPVQPSVQVPAPVQPAVQQVTVPETPEPEAIETAETETPAIATEGRAEDQDGKDRRGRRSRRRRSRGRGFPESKYASDVTREGSAEVDVVEDDAEPAEVLLLPGESLAKYTNRTPTPTLPENAEPDAGEDIDPKGIPTLSREDVAARAERASGDISQEEIEELDLVAGFEGAEAAQDTEGRREIAASPVSDLPVVTSTDPIIDIAIDTVEEDDDSTADIEDQVDAAERRLSAGLDELSEDPDGSDQDSDEGADDAIDLLTIAEGTEDGGYTAQLGDLDEIAAEAGAGEALTSAPEGAGAETSATASVRDESGRYQHRQSRRMRRRRGGDRGERTETPVVVAEPDPRQAPRTERPERGGERAERSDRPDRPLPSISDLLREGQEIIVQIAKEPLGQKGARITSHIALPGRFVVYMPTLDHVGVSLKISTEEERLRLKRILQNSRTGLSGGFIVRTAGEGRSEEEIAGDMAYLYNLWLDIRHKAEKRKAPALLHHDLDIVHRILRDQLSDMFKAIWADNEEVYESILRFMQRFQPSLVGRVKMYTRRAPIFDAFNITNEIEKALRPKVWLKSGGYIVINQTEALVAIDVNTGKFVGKSNRLEDTITKTNTEAVKEIVRQIRLRDLGGIIVVDFIDMDERKNRQKVMQALEEAMRADRAPYKILQFNDFGLVAITRKRVKQSLERTLCSPCPTCEGAGYTKSVATVVGEILQEATKVRQVVEGKNVELRVYPEVARHLKSNTNSDLEEIESILGCSVLVITDSSLHPEKFDMAW